MCGRYDLSETPASVGRYYRIGPGKLTLFTPNADVRPTETQPVVIVDGAGERALRLSSFLALRAAPVYRCTLTNPC